jgi:spore coat protein U-like protein
MKRESRETTSQVKVAAILPLQATMTTAYNYALNANNRGQYQSQARSRCNAQAAKCG